MNSIKELEKLLKTEVLISKQKDTEDLKTHLEYMLDVKKYYEEVLVHIEKNILSQEDAVKILQDLEDMSDDEDDI
jgi:predicted glycosyltransferase